MNSSFSFRFAILFFLILSAFASLCWPLGHHWWEYWMEKNIFSKYVIPNAKGTTQSLFHHVFILNHLYSPCSPPSVWDVTIFILAIRASPEKIHFSKCVYETHNPLLELGPAFTFRANVNKDRPLGFSKLKKIIFELSVDFTFFR